MTKNNLETTFQKNGHVAVDPFSCDSMVSWHVSVQKKKWTGRQKNEEGTWVPTPRMAVMVQGSLVMTDCSRRIGWDFVEYLNEEDRGFNIDKLDKAINELTAFRAAMQEAQVQADKDSEEAKAVNPPDEGGPLSMFD